MKYTYPSPLGMLVQPIHLYLLGTAAQLEQSCRLPQDARDTTRSATLEVQVTRQPASFPLSLKTPNSPHGWQ